MHVLGFLKRKQGISGSSDKTDTLVLMSVHCSLHPFVARNTQIKQDWKFGKFRL